MRKIKKLIALAVLAACVVTMGSPVAVKADDVEVCAVSGCANGNHVTKYVELGTSVSTSTHEYDNGKICTITTTYQNYYITCECGAISGGTTSTPISIVHSSCGNQ